MHHPIRTTCTTRTRAATTDAKTEETTDATTYTVADRETTITDPTPGAAVIRDAKKRITQRQIVIAGVTATARTATKEEEAQAHCEHHPGGARAEHRAAKAKERKEKALSATSVENEDTLLETVLTIVNGTTVAAVVEVDTATTAQEADIAAAVGRDECKLVA